MEVILVPTSTAARHQQVVSHQTNPMFNLTLVHVLQQFRIVYEQFLTPL